MCLFICHSYFNSNSWFLFFPIFSPRFTRDKRVLPVLWHQSLLTFVQRYKEDISSEQKKALLDLIRVHTHASITPEIRREIVNSKCRDEENQDNAIAAME